MCVYHRNRNDDHYTKYIDLSRCVQAIDFDRLGLKNVPLHLFQPPCRVDRARTVGKINKLISLTSSKSLSQVLRFLLKTLQFIK